MNQTIAADTKWEEGLAFDSDHRVLSQTPFHEVSRTLKREVYGVPYVELTDSSGGTIWLTRHGWNFREQLEPAKWYGGRRYDRKGEHLTKGSGAVFRVISHDSVGRAVNLVVKFSRMAQDLPLQVSSRFPDGLPRHVLDESVFNDPFEEFGVLDELRRGEFGPLDVQVRTKRPLAIYSPGQRLKPWQLGRSEHQFIRHTSRLAKDQKGLAEGMQPVHMHFDRQYITLFQWVRGQDAEALVKAGVISEIESSELVVQVVKDLATKGFRMLDIKPNHIILRLRPNGSLLTRRGQLSYALVDFELLQRTEEYRKWRETQ
jgi:hypothetical protein